MSTPVFTKSCLFAALVILACKTSCPAQCCGSSANAGDRDDGADPKATSYCPTEFAGQWYDLHYYLCDKCGDGYCDDSYTQSSYDSHDTNDTCAEGYEGCPEEACIDPITKRDRDLVAQRGLSSHVPPRKTNGPPGSCDDPRGRFRPGPNVRHLSNSDQVVKVGEPPDVRYFRVLSLHVDVEGPDKVIHIGQELHPGQAVKWYVKRGRFIDSNSRSHKRRIKIDDPDYFDNRVIDVVTVSPAKRDARPE